VVQTCCLFNARIVLFVDLSGLQQKSTGKLTIFGLITHIYKLTFVVENLVLWAGCTIIVIMVARMVYKNIDWLNAK
jgi:hypothetical protein